MFSTIKFDMKSDQYSIEQKYYVFLSKTFSSINETQDLSNKLDSLHLKYCQAGFNIHTCIVYFLKLNAKCKTFCLIKFHPTRFSLSFLVIQDNTKHFI